jgi:GntR family transcriptional regulator, histidine utilization repressor
MNEAQPLYAQVKDHIMENIRSGLWLPGARVPSENELVERFGISRMTANRALRDLTLDGYLARVPGVGTFVKEPPARSSLLELRNIAEEIEARGHRHSSRIEKRGEIAASAAQAGEFEMNEGQRLFHVVLVHAENDVPVQIEDRYVNPFVAPNFLIQTFGKTTPTAYLLASVPVDELEHTVEATLPTAQQQHLLGIEAGEPCLVLHRRSWSKGHVVTAATFTYPASRYALYSRYKTSAQGTISQ